MAKVKEGKDKIIFIILLLVLGTFILNNNFIGEHINRWEGSPLFECVPKCEKGEVVVSSTCNKQLVCSEGKVVCHAKGYTYGDGLLPFVRNSDYPGDCVLRPKR